MDIFSRITNNLFQRARTRRPTDTVPHPSGFRGELLHDTDLCTACGTCAYVCSPSAIVVDRSLPQEATWAYQMMQCTFCGRCVDYCPTHALSFGQRLAQPVFAVRHTSHRVPNTLCAQCGEAIFPLPLPVLEATYGSPVPPEMEQMNRLCERCRKKAYSARIKHSFTGS